MISVGNATGAHAQDFLVGDELILIYLLTEIGLTAGGSSTVDIYTQTIHRTTQKKQKTNNTQNSTKNNT
jgi:hypothetical protein